MFLADCGSLLFLRCFIYLKRLATHEVAGTTGVLAAELAEQKIAWLQREVADLLAGREDMEREREELCKAVDGKALYITARMYLSCW